MTARKERTPDTMGTNAVAAVLGVSSRTVTRWADEGLLPVARHTTGGHRRFDPAAVTAFGIRRIEQAQQ